MEQQIREQIAHLQRESRFRGIWQAGFFSTRL